MNKDNWKETASTLWREVSREARTSLGRRLSSGEKKRPIERPPPGAHSLTVQEDEGGWDVVERKAPQRTEVREWEEPIVSMAASYIVAGETGPAEEDSEYRRAWNLPSRPPKAAAGARRASSTASAPSPGRPGRPGSRA